MAGSMALLGALIRVLVLFRFFFFFLFRSESDLSFPYQFLFLLISLGRDVIFPVLGDFPFFFFLFFQCMYVCVGPSDVNDV